MVTAIHLGTDWELDQQTMDELEEFTCSMYGFRNSNSVDRVRSTMLKKMTGGNSLNMTMVKKVDMSKLPPCRRSLTMHILRVNYRICQWKRSHLPSPHIPPPGRENGWCQGEGFLEPLWSDGPVLPQSLLDVVQTVTPQAANTDDSSVDSDDDDVVSMAGSCYSSSSDSDID